MGMLDTRDNDLSFDGEERRANVVLRGISCHERLTEWNGLLRQKRSYPLMSTTAMAGEANRVSLQKLANPI